MQQCSLHHWTFTTRHIISCAVGKGCLLGLSRKIEHCFCFGSAASCFLELFVFAFLSSPIAHWASSDLGAHLPFHTLHGVLAVRILEWFATPSSGGPHFVTTLHYDHYLKWPCTSWLLASWSYANPFTMTRL